MNELIEPLDTISATVKIPGSKSIANRALITAALANGTTKIENFPLAEDCIIMLEALKKFGVNINLHNDTLKITGNPDFLRAPEEEIYTANAGTVMRFLTSFSTLANGMTILTGDKRMLERPIGALAEALNNLGADVNTADGFPPVKIRGKKFKGGHTIINTNFSSQFLSSILLSAPYAENSVNISVKNSIPSRPYVDMTLDVMNNFGVRVHSDSSSFYVDNKVFYKPIEYIIEGDYSSASYFILAAMITRGEIKLLNIKENSKQADAKILDIAKEMNCVVGKIENGIWVNAKNVKIKAMEIDANNFPDLVPTLAILALFADGKSKIYNVAHLRYKETDRLEAISNELRKLGVDVVEFPDGIIISPQKSYNGVEIETYNDHRLAMSFAIAGLRISGIRIKNPECVKKSFPEFWKEFKKLY
ncbi:MAG: 5-Enolpyruvylshikimate-3-phosphate synthase [Ignavibacteriae bacterium]|nr:MAG: 5-Enolpyruvylshikimate-3-phosphate synthase [Ignavibacteriota bacterium]